MFTRLPRFRSIANMKFKPMSFLGRLAVMAFILAGCASHPPDPRVVYSNASVNAHPARMWLDTGSYSTGLFPKGARRLGLNAPKYPNRHPYRSMVKPSQHRSPFFASPCPCA